MLQLVHTALRKTVARLNLFESPALCGYMILRRLLNTCWTCSCRYSQ